MDFSSQNKTLQWLYIRYYFKTTLHRLGVTNACSDGSERQKNIFDDNLFWNDVKIEYSKYCLNKGCLHVVKVIIGRFTIGDDGQRNIFCLTNVFLHNF